MDPMTIGIMAGLGLGKSMLVDAPREKRQRKLAAQTQLYSPWTGMTADRVQEADPFASALQGAGTGAMFSQAQESNDIAKEEMKLKYPQAASAVAPSTVAPANLAPYGVTQAGAIDPELQKRYMQRQMAYQSGSFNPYSRMS